MSVANSNFSIIARISWLLKIKYTYNTIYRETQLYLKLKAYFNTNSYESGSDFSVSYTRKTVHFNHNLWDAATYI